MPVRVAYDRWTRFEDFPSFMDGVDRVEQLDDKTLRWTATVAGIPKTWTAEITDQTPNTRVAWKSVDGAENAGAVLFAPKGGDRTEVILRIDAEPEGAVENVGDALGFLQRRSRATSIGSRISSSEPEPVSMVGGARSTAMRSDRIPRTRAPQPLPADDRHAVSEAVISRPDAGFGSADDPSAAAVPAPFG